MHIPLILTSHAITVDQFLENIEKAKSSLDYSALFEEAY